MQFRYTAPTFVNAERARFRYRLRGRDDAWHEAGEERVACFTNLKPGDYVFEVTACNAHGVWQQAPATFAFSVAPHLWQTWPFQAGVGVIALGIAGGIQARRLQQQRRLLRLEQQRALEAERGRIAHDLHDDLGASLTSLALELDLVRREAPLATEWGGRLEPIAQAARETAERMREVVWTLNPRCDSLDSFVTHVAQHTERFLAGAGIRVRFDFPEPVPARPLAAEVRHQLFLVVKEALHNVVKHAHATEVTLRLETDAARLRLTLADNGRGFGGAESGQPPKPAGHELASLRRRVERLHGNLSIETGSGQGVRVTVEVPWLPAPPQA